MTTNDSSIDISQDKHIYKVFYENAENILNFTSGYQVGCSNVSVDLNITIPAKEPGGSEENKTSIATFISSLAEEKVS